MAKKQKTPWPTEAAMSQIYEKKLWGGNSHTDFYSGEGSHNTAITTPYIYSVTAFLKSHSPRLRICDLGCGDFNIGKQLWPYTRHYHAIDIVPKLIERNTSLYKANNLQFHCLDISEDDLPDADCIILRQVLQHLSNKEVVNILKKLKTYKYIILTEHLPNTLNFTPNKDIISGQGIRLKHQSGIAILKPPFNFTAKRVTLLDVFVLPKGQIVTQLYEVY